MVIYYLACCGINAMLWLWRYSPVDWLTVAGLRKVYYQFNTPKYLLLAFFNRYVKYYLHISFSVYVDTPVCIVLLGGTHFATKGDSSQSLSPIRQPAWWIDANSTYTISTLKCVRKMVRFVSLFFHMIPFGAFHLINIYIPFPRLSTGVDYSQKEYSEPA